VLLQLPYLTLTSVVTLIRLLPMSDVDKNVEILACSPGRARSTDLASPRPTGPSSPPWSTDSPRHGCGNCT
jgi:hypothetical protein